MPDPKETVVEGAEEAAAETVIAEAEAQPQEQFDYEELVQEEEAGGEKDWKAMAEALQKNNNEWQQYATSLEQRSERQVAEYQRQLAQVGQQRQQAPAQQQQQYQPPAEQQFQFDEDTPDWAKQMVADNRAMKQRLQQVEQGTQRQIQDFTTGFTQNQLETRLTAALDNATKTGPWVARGHVVEIMQGNLQLTPEQAVVQAQAQANQQLGEQNYVRRVTKKLPPHLAPGGPQMPQIPRPTELPTDLDELEQQLDAGLENFEMLGLTE